MSKEKQHISHSLLMSYLLEEADALQIDKVDKWLSVSEDNAKYLKSLELLWIETGKLIPPPVDVDTVEAWKNVSSQIMFSTAKEITLQSTKTNRLKMVWRAAAILIIFIGSYSIFKLMSGKIETITLASNEQIISDTLTDGSIVSINKKSVLTFPEKFDKSERVVKLEGEAFFYVEHNENQPFIIELNHANVKVLGTSFNVKEIPEENMVEVYVKTGTVMLFSVNEERDTFLIVLNKGEKGQLNTKSGIAGKPDDEGMNANDISWYNDSFAFDGVRLDDVAEFLESFYIINIEFSNDSIKSHLLTATFSNDDIDDIMNIIAGSFNLEINKKNHTFIIDEPKN